MNQTKEEMFEKSWHLDLSVIIIKGGRQFVDSVFWGFFFHLSSYLLALSVLQVFKCLPYDSVHNMQELKDYSAEERLCDTAPERAAEELKAIRGLLVHFPLKFLCEESLLPSPTTMEGMAPVGLWT